MGWILYCVTYATFSKKKSSLIAQSEIRAMMLECARVGGINLAQGVCDTEVPLPVRTGAQEAIAKKMIGILMI